MVHLLLEGTCWLEIDAQPPMELRAGDVIMLPHGAGHRLLSAPGNPARALEEFSPVPLGDASFRLTAGGMGPRTRLVCCGVHFDEPAIHPLLALMPQVLVARDEIARTPALASLLEAMRTELREQRIGAGTVITRLADIIVTQVVRAWAEERSDRAQGWSAAMRDPQVGRALAAFHAAPERRWSVASLAAAANLSRSAFSERFRSAVGMSPAQYAGRWRIQLAAAWLRSNELTIDQIAARLGFGSEVSFSRTFKRLVGSSPASFRRAAARRLVQPTRSRSAGRARAHARVQTGLSPRQRRR